MANWAVALVMTAAIGRPQRSAAHVLRPVCDGGRRLAFVTEEPPVAQQELGVALAGMDRRHKTDQGHRLTLHKEVGRQHHEVRKLIGLDGPLDVGFVSELRVVDGDQPKNVLAFKTGAAKYR